MSSKPPEASPSPSPSLPPSAVNEATSAKIPSIPVLSVGTPSRPPPGTSAALAAGIIPPSPRAPQASQPLISTPIAPPTSSEPPPGSRTDSNPPTGRKLAPPPKTRRQSVPVPAPSDDALAADAAHPLVEIVRSAPPPALEPAPAPATTSSTPAPPPPDAPAQVLPPAQAAAPAAAVPPAPAVPSAVSPPVAAAPSAVAPPTPPAFPAFPPVPSASASPPPAPATPVAAPGGPIIPPPAPAAAVPGNASVPPKPVPQPPRPQSTEPMLARAALEAATAAAAEPPPAPARSAPEASAPRPAAEPPTRPAAEAPTRPSSAEPPPSPPRAASDSAPAPARPPSDRAPGALPLDFGLEPGGHARVTPPQRLPLPLPRPSEPPPPAHVIVGADASHSQSKPTPAPAINVMRIIAIGTPKPAPEVPDDDVVEEALADVEHDEDTPIVDRSDGPDIAVDVVMEPAELDDVELAPDSGEDKRPSGEVLELEGEDALSVPPEDAILPDTVPDLAGPAAEARGGAAPAAARPAEVPVVEAPVSEGKPPPPPLRKPQPPRRGDSSRPRPRRALKRPWWEDIFGEDFTRAVPRLTEKQVSREVDFIEESLGVAKGGVVLDLGCGAGHHAVDLAGRGYGVVGYDLSVYQLALAADVAQEQNQKINFLQGDMREMAFEAMFDGIYCWNTSFGYFEEDKNAAVAERVFRALKPGGMFLVDVANRDFAAMYSPSQLWYEGDSCVCMDDMSVDFITSRLRVKRSVIFDDGRSRECTYSIRLYSLHELGKLLHDVGFRVTEASGHPSTPGVFFGELSPRLIVLAQKP